MLVNHQHSQQIIPFLQPQNQIKNQYWMICDDNKEVDE